MEFFPSVPPSAIAGALGKAGGNVEQAADLLFTASQERLRVLWVLGEPPSYNPRMWSGRKCAVGTHMCTHGRTSMGTRKGMLKSFNAVSTRP
jgi:hypothetical protein